MIYSNSELYKISAWAMDKFDGKWITFAPNVFRNFPNLGLSDGVDFICLNETLLVLNQKTIRMEYKNNTCYDSCFLVLAKNEICCIIYLNATEKQLNSFLELVI